MGKIEIAPLVIDAEPSLKHIDVPVRFAGRDPWVAVAEMSNVPIRSLRSRQGDLRALEDEVSRA